MTTITNTDAYEALIGLLNPNPWDRTDVPVERLCESCGRVEAQEIVYLPGTDGESLAAFEVCSECAPIPYAVVELGE